MSKKRPNSKRYDSNWLDRDNHPYKEDETICSWRLDNLRLCIDSDSFFDFDCEDVFATETGKNKQITEIQNICRPSSLRRKSILQCRRMNKYSLKKRGNK